MGTLLESRFRTSQILESVEQSWNPSVHYRAFDVLGLDIPHGLRDSGPVLFGFAFWVGCAGELCDSWCRYWFDWRFCVCNAHVEQLYRNGPCPDGYGGIRYFNLSDSVYPETVQCDCVCVARLLRRHVHAPDVCAAVVQFKASVGGACARGEQCGSKSLRDCV